MSRETLFKVMINFKLWFWNVKFLHMTSRKLRPWGMSHQMVYHEFCLEKNVWYTPAFNPSNGFSIFSLHGRMIMQCQPTSCAIMQHDTCTTKTIPKISNRHPQNKTNLPLLNSREDEPDPNSGPHVPGFWEPQFTCSMSENSDEMKYPQRKGNPAVLAVTASYNLATFLLPG